MAGPDGNGPTQDPKEFPCVLLPRAAPACASQSRVSALLTSQSAQFSSVAPWLVRSNCQAKQTEVAKRQLVSPMQKDAPPETRPRSPQPAARANAPFPSCSSLHPRPARGSGRPPPSPTTHVTLLTRSDLSSSLTKELPYLEAALYRPVLPGPGCLHPALLIHLQVELNGRRRVSVHEAHDC